MSYYLVEYRIMSYYLVEYRIMLFNNETEFRFSRYSEFLVHYYVFLKCKKEQDQ